MTNKFVALRNAILDATANGEANIEPRTVGLVGQVINDGISVALDHVGQHTKDDLLEMIAGAKRLDRMKMQMYIDRWINSDERDNTHEPPAITEIMDAGFLTQVNAVEVIALFALLPMLAATDDPKASQIIANRPEYTAALSLAGVLLARHFPTVSLPTGDTQAADTASAPSPAPASEERPLVTAAPAVLPENAE